MEKNRNFRFFGIFILVFIILSLYFVLAALAPINLTFEQNTTSTFDKEGIFTVNWTTGGTGDFNYTIYISTVTGVDIFAVPKNDSTTGFSFSNTTDANYIFIVEAENSTGKANSTSINITVDTTDPTVSYIAITPVDNAAANRDWIYVNVSVTEANEDTITFELHNSTALVNSTSFTDATRTINFTGLPINVVYSYNVTVNDSATRSFTAATRTFTLDNIAPSLGLTKTTSGQTSLILSISGIDGICTVDRSGATLSGSTITETGLSCGISYSYIVTCTDAAGNAGSSSATSFSTTGCSSSGVITPKPKKASYSFSKITPGVVTILKNFDAEFGIKEIKIEVNNPAQSVSIIVIKEDGKPAEVSVEKSGKVYKYLQIESTNLVDNFGKATVTLQVEKSWLSSNGLDANEIALFRFDENSKKWNELVTTYTESEGDNELYEVELTSFSYFAISESLLAEEGVDGVIGKDGVEIGREKSSVWWKVLILVLVVLIIYVVMNKKKYSKLLKQ